MASPLSGSDLDEVELVVVETNDLSLYIKGKPFHPRYESLKQYRGHSIYRDETMSFRCEGDGSEIVKVYDVSSGELRELGAFPPIFFENGVYQLVVSSKDGRDLQFYHEHPGLRKAVGLVGREPNRLLMGNLRFTNEVGLTTFEIRDGDRRLLEITLEIFPTKLDYKKDYKKLLEEVNEEVYNLAFHFVKKTYLGATAIVSKKPSLAEFYRLLQAHFTHFTQALNLIEQQPHHELRTVYQKVRGDQLKRLDSRGRRYLQKRPQLFQDVSNGIQVSGRNVMPESGMNAKKALSFDTLENRFVKWMINRLIYRLDDLREKVVSHSSPYGKEADPAFIHNIDDMKNKLGSRLRQPFWKTIGKLDRSVMSLVMQMKPGYKDAYQTFLIVSRGLTLWGQIYKMSVKDIAVLYEYWTFLKLGQILSRKYESVSQDIVQVTTGGLFVNLDQSSTATRVFRQPLTGEKITLEFQSLDKKLPTAAQKPDTMLRISKKGKSFTYNFIFDAKYRIDFAGEGSYYKRHYHSPGPLEEDINIMHRYRDAHVAEHDGPYERTAFGAYVLFPLFEEDEYENHKFYRSINKVNIGAFPFLPNTTRLVEQFLEHLIEKSPEEIQREGILPQGSKEEWQSSLEEKVIVGLVNGQKNYDAHRKDLFYHIPVKRLKKGWQDAEYLALYLPKNRFQKEYGILFYGKITDVKIVPRNEIRSLQKSSRENYAIFLVDGWRRLDQAVTPVGYGIQVYTMTTLNLLKQARELPELFMKSEDEVTLWRMLRRLSYRVNTELDHSYLDQATGILSYQVKDLNIRLNRKEEQIEVSRKNENLALSTKWLKTQPTKVFKELTALLSRN